MNENATQWYLKMDDNSVFGPAPEHLLREWAEQGRIIPGNKISRDQKQWVATETLTALNLDWMIQLPNGPMYGPLNLMAVTDLIIEGTVAPDALMVHTGTQEETSADKLLDATPETPVTAQHPPASMPVEVAATPTDNAATTALEAELEQVRQKLEAANNTLEVEQKLAAETQTKLDAANQKEVRAGKDVEAARQKETQARKDAEAAQRETAEIRKQQETAQQQATKAREQLEATQREKTQARKEANAQQDTTADIQQQLIAAQADIESERLNASDLQKRLDTLEANAQQDTTADIQQQLDAAQADIESERRNVSEIQRKLDLEKAEAAAARKKLEAKKKESADAQQHASNATLASTELKQLEAARAQAAETATAELATLAEEKAEAAKQAALELASLEAERAKTAERATALDATRQTLEAKVSQLTEELDAAHHAAETRAGAEAELAKQQVAYETLSEKSHNKETELSAQLQTLTKELRLATEAGGENHAKLSAAHKDEETRVLALEERDVALDAHTDVAAQLEQRNVDLRNMEMKLHEKHEQTQEALSELERLKASPHYNPEAIRLLNQERSRVAELQLESRKREQEFTNRARHLATDLERANAAAKARAEAARQLEEEKSRHRDALATNRQREQKLTTHVQELTTKILHLTTDRDALAKKNIDNVHALEDLASLRREHEALQTDTSEQIHQLSERVSGLSSHLDAARKDRSTLQKDVEEKESLITAIREAGSKRETELNQQINMLRETVLEELAQEEELLAREKHLYESIQVEFSRNESVGKDYLVSLGRLTAAIDGEKEEDTSQPPTPQSPTPTDT